jgi:hypothetical protein
MENNLDFMRGSKQFELNEEKKKDDMAIESNVVTKELDDKRKENEASAGSSVKKKRKTVDDKIQEAKALLKLLNAEKKKVVSGKSKSLTKTSKGMTNLIDALKAVSTENKVSTADVIKALAMIKAVGVRGKNLNDVDISIDLNNTPDNDDKTKEALECIKMMKKTTKSSVIIY